MNTVKRWLRGLGTTALAVGLLIWMFLNCAEPVPTADQWAERACNHWTAGLYREPPNRDAMLTTLRESASMAKAAAKEPRYAALKASFTYMVAGFEDQEFASYEVAATAGFDECNAVPGIRKDRERFMDELRLK